MPIECPHCGTLTTLHLRDQWATPTRESSGANVAFAAWSCASCGQPIVGEAAPDVIEGVLPVPGFSWPTRMSSPPLPPNLPTEVADDAKAAHRCLAIGQWRASAAMARRAIQGACIDKGAPAKRLVEQIDWLEAQRLITPLMKDVAHTIRLEGNTGAHPDRDGLRDVGEGEAHAVVGFLDDFIKYVYEIPGRLAGGEAPAPEPT